MRNNAKKKLALDALLAGKSITKAAAAAGVHRNTLSTWLKDPSFSAPLHEAESESMGELSRLMLNMASRAAVTLYDAMGDPEASAGVRIRAADTVLARLLQLRELATLEERITALERSQQNGK